jgi:hypothetical protein
VAEGFGWVELIDFGRLTRTGLFVKVLGVDIEVDRSREEVRSHRVTVADCIVGVERGVTPHGGKADGNAVVELG